jgi:hypothetical protein
VPGDENSGKGAEVGVSDLFDDLEWLTAELDRLCEERERHGLSASEHARFVVLCGLEADLLSPDG